MMLLALSPMIQAKILEIALRCTQKTLQAKLHEQIAVRAQRRHCSFEEAFNNTIFPEWFWEEAATASDLVEPLPRYDTIEERLLAMTQEETPLRESAWVLFSTEVKRGMQAALQISQPAMRGEASALNKETHGRVIRKHPSKPT